VSAAQEPSPWVVRLPVDPSARPWPLPLDEIRAPG
jgi:hypothetical protein